jgi:hypothetical protein
MDRGGARKKSEGDDGTAEFGVGGAQFPNKAGQSLPAARRAAAT